MDNLVQKIQLPKIIDKRGSLSFLESNNHIPFNIRTTSIITDLNNFKNSSDLKINNDQFIIVLSGSLTIKVINQNTDEIINLNKPNIGIFISGKLEINFIKFSPNSILLVLRSDSNEK